MISRYLALHFLVLLCLASSISASGPDINDALALIKSDQSEQALPILLPLADKGNAEAMIALGYYFLLEKEDEPKGLSWFRRGALSGDAEAQLHLGLVLTEILSGNENFLEGVDWLKKAGAQGNKSAAEQLASIYYLGKKGSIKKDNALSDYWSNRAKGN